MKPNYPEGKVEFAADVPNLEGYTEEAIALAVKRFEVLHPLVGKKRDRNEIKAATDALGVNRARVYQMLSALKRDPRPIALLPTKAGRRPGLAPLKPRVEEVVQAALHDMLTRKEEHTFAMIFDAVRAACFAQKVKPPGYKYLRKRLDSIPAQERGAMKHGKREADRLHGPVMGNYLVEAPLQQFQIDHTKLDVIIVDSATGAKIDRPWLTLVIDVHSRAIMAFHLSLEAPSAKTLGLALSMAVWPKKTFLDDREIPDVDWPMFGMPKEIFVDNGADMRSLAFERGCMSHNIKLKFRKDVHAGGIIERLVGTITGRTHILPGTTGSNTKARKNYDSEAQAFLTLWDVERWMTYEVQRYHHKIHTSLKTTPLLKWHQGLREARIRPEQLGTSSQRQFFISFLPSEIRTCRAGGVNLFGERYVGDVLASRIGEMVEVRYNPADHRQIYVRDESGTFYSAGNIDPTTSHIPRSFAELRAVRRAKMNLSRPHGESNPELEAILQQGRIVEQSKQKRRLEEARRRITAEHLPLQEQGRSSKSKKPGVAIDFSQPISLLEKL